MNYQISIPEVQNECGEIVTETSWPKNISENPKRSINSGKKWRG